MYSYFPPGGQTHTLSLLKEHSCEKESWKLTSLSQDYQHYVSSRKRLQVRELGAERWEEKPWKGNEGSHSKKSSCKRGGGQLCPGFWTSSFQLDVLTDGFTGWLSCGHKHTSFFRQVERAESQLASLLEITSNSCGLHLWKTINPTCTGNASLPINLAIWLNCLQSYYWTARRPTQLNR